jgi:hypothetical protein
MSRLSELATSDFLLANHGSVLILHPLTDDAREWVGENIPDDAMSWGRGVVIEPRYWEPIEHGILDAGLTIH